TAIAPSNNAHPGWVDDALLRQIADPVGQIGLHLATPLAVPSFQESLTHGGSAIVRLQNRVTLVGECLRPPVELRRIPLGRATMRSTTSGKLWSRCPRGSVR